MEPFQYVASELHAEGVPLSRIAEEFGTPTFVYSAAAITQNVETLQKAFEGSDALVCYALKASSNLALLALIGRLGAGFDIVSGGELGRVLAAGGKPERIVFSGVGKTKDEMRLGLKAGIRMFNVESAEELLALDAVGRELGRVAPFSLRVNPVVDAKTHKYISTGLRTSKFGIPFPEARQLFKKSLKLTGVKAVGVDVHIGSQITTLAPLKAAMEKTAELYLQLKSQHVPLDTVDIGGGLGITYTHEKPPSPQEYADAVKKALASTGARIVTEPGRVLVGNAAVLLTQVLYRKKSPDKTFVIVDAAMNDLIRPALYQAHHDIRPVKKSKAKATVVDVVGPVCESGDFLAKDRKMPFPAQGDLLAVMSAGAYAMTMASNYNTRPRAAEVLVDGDRHRVIRPREPLESLWKDEG